MEHVFNFIIKRIHHRNFSRHLTPNCLIMMRGKLMPHEEFIWNHTFHCGHHCVFVLMLNIYVYHWKWAVLLINEKHSTVRLVKYPGNQTNYANTPSQFQFRFEINSCSKLQENYKSKTVICSIQKIHKKYFIKDWN